MKNIYSKFLIFIILILNITFIKPEGFVEKFKNIIFSKSKKSSKNNKDLTLQEEYENTYAEYLENPSNYEICKKLSNLIVSLSQIKQEDYKSFDSVIGLNEPKNELKILIDFLKNTEKYNDLNLKIEKGILLVSDEGNGKSFLARSIAGEANVPFFYINVLDIVEKWSNLAGLIIKDLSAKVLGTKGVIFIDNLDALKQGNPANKGLFLSTITNLTNHDIIVIGAVRNKKIFDESFFRPGRFEKIIYLDYPDLSEREKLLYEYTKDLLLDDSVNLKQIAMYISGFTRKEIVKLVNDIAVNAINQSRNIIINDIINSTLENTAYGQKWETLHQTQEEKKFTAYHEAGHTLVNVLLCEHFQPIKSVTIAPKRNGALGLTAGSYNKDIYMSTKEDILADIKLCLGGKAAEELVFGRVAIGSSSDLWSATNQVKKMICLDGMSEKLGLAINDPWNKNYSEKTAQLIDEEVKNILNSCYKETLNLLFENRDKLDKLANALLEKETLYANEIYEILGIKK